MGSDSIQKSTRSYRIVGNVTHDPSICRNYLLFLLLIITCMFLPSLLTLLRHDPGNHVPINSFKLRRQYAAFDNRTITPREIEAASKELPGQCIGLLEHLKRCQSSREIVVFGCHRKWCSSWYGHCEEVNGIGDRTQRMLSMVTDAMDKCIRIELDYPQTRNGIELRFPSSLEYRDPWGEIAEWLHFRSYDVSDQGEVDVDSWGKFQDVSSVQRTFVHFTPRGYKWHRQYDPCLYHILFQITNDLQTELSYYEDLFQLKQGNTIGIHFRTGDLTAFGVKNMDVRAQKSSLQSSYDKMVSCAGALAHRLQLSHDSSGKYHFFLATDNEHVKEMAQNDERYKIHMIHEQPSPYLVSDGDRTAYLDLYLLSKTRGLTVNVLPHGYNGPAERVSTFARLAWNIGFMNNDQLYECEIE